VSLANSKQVRLNYGEDRCFSCEVDAGRIVASPTAPESDPDFESNLDAILESPLDFPPLRQAVIPGDRVVLALDGGTPRAASLVAAVWKVLSKSGVAPDDVLVIQTPAATDTTSSDPRVKLPASIRRKMAWKVHDANDDDEAFAYLGATASGERIFLAREVVDADIAVSIGVLGFDPVIGYRGTSSVFYPGLSNAETRMRALGQGHRELGPDDVRPFRQIIDEVGCMLGTLFSLQVVPSTGAGVAHVLAGAADSVLQRGQKLLREEWLIRLESRPDIVVAAVDGRRSELGWDAVASAVATARNLVSQGGKILILSELESPGGEGLQMLRHCDNPRDCIEPMRERGPSDFAAVSELASAVDWAGVYLLSNLDSNLVEDLFVVPVENEVEASRLLSGDETCVFLSSAHHACGRIGDD